MAPRSSRLVSGSTVHALSQTSYDALGHLECSVQQQVLDLGGTARDLTLGFAYNPASQIASTARSNHSYAWTGHGSGTTSTTSNGLNRIASWTGALGYDARGNVTGDGTYGYAYSSENLLTALTNSASGAIQASSTFTYDPLMRRGVEAHRARRNSASQSICLSPTRR